MPSPAASTNPSPSVTAPGLRLPRSQPLYSLQFTQSKPTFSQMTTNTSLPSLKIASTTPRRSRLARPGTLTRTELLGLRSRPLRWLSPSTPSTFPSSSPPSASSQSGSKSRKRRKITATPNALTATVSDTPTPDAPRNTQLVPIAHYTILAQRTIARTPPPLPTARTAARTTTPSLENAELDLSPHLNPRPPDLPRRNYRTPPPIVRKPWMWPTMAAEHPLLPMTLQPVPSTFPPRDPSSNPETPPPPPADPSQHPLAGTCCQ